MGYFLSEPFCFLLNRTVLLFLKLGRSCFFSNWDGPAFSQTGTVLLFLKLGRSWLFSNWDGPGFSQTGTVLAFLKLGRSCFSQTPGPSPLLLIISNLYFFHYHKTASNKQFFLDVFDLLIFHSIVCCIFS